MELTPQERAQIVRVGEWQAGLADRHARVGPRFRRPEVRARVGRSLAALLGPLERRTGWQLAEQAGERTPDGVQRLLRTARWDADAVRDDLRAYVVEPLGDPQAVLIVDETGFLQKGTKSVGVARHYSGTAGRIEHCQLGVFLAYASPTGHAFLDRALSLPKAWAEDLARRREAGVPSDVPCATKPELAKRMLARAFAAQVPAAWVTGDEPYGNDGAWRRWLAAEQQPDVLAVARSHAVWTDTEGGLAQVRADELVATIPADGWPRLEVGAGSKGPRVFDWACGRLPDRTQDGWTPWLLIRRSVSRPAALAFSHAYGRLEPPVEALARGAGARWAIEEGCERAKGEVGLDQYEVRSWAGWYRHATLCLLAHAFLAVTRTTASASPEKGARPPTFSH